MSNFQFFVLVALLALTVSGLFLVDDSLRSILILLRSVYVG